ncbi:MAG TPA: cyclic nucleotide-binding domain-containing protein [Thermodesulfobacteriota bacterium]|nr:cyclic nucleotide-binding domain-containing protein [Thermodesulfobacteriota bacterium]
MFAQGWKVIRGVRRGDWRSRLIIVSQGSIGLVALLGLATMLTPNPFLLLAFATSQGLIVVGVFLFAIVAVFAQRTLVVEEFGPGEEIVREGDLGRDVYIIKAGMVDVLKKQPDGSQEAIKRLGPGDHFGEMALLREAKRNATIRTVTQVEVFSMKPSSFFALYTHFPGLREQIDRIMQDRLEDLRRGD